MPRIVVLGAAGALGSHLCDRLLGRGYEVVGVDDLSTGTFANVAHLRGHPRFAFVEHDLVEPFQIEANGIFHLAVPSRRSHVEGDPVRAAHTCVAGSMHALASARATGASLVFVTSTDRAGEGVHCAESMAMHYRERSGVDVRVVRLADVYGPRMRPSSEDPVSALVLAAVRPGGGDLALDDAPDRRLRIVYVDDAVETLVRAMACAVPIPPIVGVSTETTLGRLAEIVATQAGLSRSTGAREDLPPRSVDVRRAAMDGALPAQLVLGPCASTSLARGVRRTLRWFAAQMQQPTTVPPSGVDDTVGDRCVASPSATETQPLGAGE